MAASPRHGEFAPRRRDQKKFLQRRTRRLLKSAPVLKGNEHGRIRPTFGHHLGPSFRQVSRSSPKRAFASWASQLFIWVSFRKLIPSHMTSLFRIEESSGLGEREGGGCRHDGFGGRERLSVGPSPRAAASARSDSDRTGLYEEITSKIIAELEAGRLPPLLGRERAHPLERRRLTRLLRTELAHTPPGARPWRQRTQERARHDRGSSPTASSPTRGEPGRASGATGRTPSRSSSASRA